ncbi:hypothetical protein EYC84_007132 [Monilinia fructicola]|uniref:Uncharacterized protein n=1 Tax=Monilinia fructicola TaxID=38448 RepID=A0A5M9K675_MONFR|nr:hypothetical protein EYC84_007132 [Monilinia fructicola]
MELNFDFLVANISDSYAMPNPEFVLRALVLSSWCTPGSTWAIRTGIYENTLLDIKIVIKQRYRPRVDKQFEENLACSLANIRMQSKQYRTTLKNISQPGI